ncbi:MAG: GNAT family N-acetyltransferase [Rhodospirillales bacterium]|nr:GNAT family N-acetyltransferase [Rhodospirillales bacterium]MCB9965863.1 GNAT family N-acetyltransferase [Rhodospirillales bacterium]MCB9973376.1 GNAT family N-acetyltransferase [Rhodospirillales bacterium]
MSLNVRYYQPEDYEDLITLYHQGHLYGGQFDENRDSREKLSDITSRDPESIIICTDQSDAVIGTVSLIEDGRVAWLFRFAVARTDREAEVSKLLYQKATDILKGRGHHQILVYTDSKDAHLKQRYKDLEMQEGGIYTCFWADM